MAGTTLSTFGMAKGPPFTNTTIVLSIALCLTLHQKKNLSSMNNAWIHLCDQFFLQSWQCNRSAIFAFKFNSSCCIATTSNSYNGYSNRTHFQHLICQSPTKCNVILMIQNSSRPTENNLIHPHNQENNTLYTFVSSSMEVKWQCLPGMLYGLK
jgi:hypothetical protein